MRPAGAFLAATLLAAASAAAEDSAGRRHSATPNAYGAIAYHRASGAWGVSYDFARQRDAAAEALRQCGDPKCEVVHRFRNGCAALADGPARLAAQSGTTRTEAEAKALRSCAEANRGAECRLLAWGCTR